MATQEEKEALLNQITASIEKSEKEAVTAKIKALSLKRKEALKAVRLIELEIDKTWDDYTSGVV